jgi:hypothetical protein
MKLNKLYFFFLDSDIRTYLVIATFVNFRPHPLDSNDT